MGGEGSGECEGGEGGFGEEGGEAFDDEGEEVVDGHSH